MMKTDFEKFAISQGISSQRLSDYEKNAKMKLIEPMILEERALNVAPMSCFSRLLYDRIIFLGTDIDSDVANIINSQLMYLNSVDDSTDIKIFINSVGGSIHDGLSIIDVMNYVKPDVATYNMGLAASMGSVILSSGTKGKRFSLPHGEVLLHQPIGNSGWGQASEIEIYYKHIQHYKDELYKILSENTGKPIEEIRIDADRDFWLTAEQAKNYGSLGLIDDIVERAR